MGFIKTTYARLVILLLLMMTGPAALAAGEGITIGQMGRNFGESFKGLGFGAWMFALLAGLVSAIIGLILWTRQHKSRDSVMVPVVMILGGAALMAVTTIIGITQTTAIGSSTATSATSQLGIGG